MIKRDVTRNYPLANATVTILAVLFSLWIGRQLALGWFSVERIIILGAAIALGLLLLRTDDDRLRLVLWLAVLSFAAGHRSVYVGRWSNFLPSELLFWTLFLLLLSRAALYHRILLPQIPWSVLWLFLWCLIGIAHTPNALSNWDNVLYWVKQWMVALPIFYVVGALITGPGHIQRAKVFLITVGLYMSTLATLERFVPQMIRALPGFFNVQQLLLITPDGFMRSMYTFWGNPIGVILVNWAALILLHSALHAANGHIRWLSLAGSVICVLAIYISGQRATWLSFGLGVFMLAFSSGRRGLALIPVLVALVFLLPRSWWTRIDTILPGETYLTDTSLLWRIDRVKWALQAIKENPLLGIGLGGRLVHNEFLAFAARIGLPALIAFVALLAGIFRRLWDLFRNGADEDRRRMGRLFLVLAVTWLVDLNTHPALSHLPVTIPYWFVIALTWRVSIIYTTSALEVAQSPQEHVMQQTTVRSKPA